MLQKEKMNVSHGNNALIAEVPEESPEFLALLTELKADGDALNDFLDVVIKNRKRVSTLEAMLKDAKAAKVIAEKELISVMADNQLESMKIDGMTISHREVTISSVSKADREAQYEWLREAGYGDLIQESVNARTFSSFMNKEYEGPVPEFVKVHKERKLFIRGLK